MKKTTADWRLVGGFSALLFLIVVLGMIGIFQIQSLNKTIDNLGEKYFPLQRADLEMKTDNSLYVMRIRNYVFWKGSKYLGAVKAAKGAEAIQEITQEFDRRLAEYSSYIQAVLLSPEAASRYQAWVKDITGLVGRLRATGSNIINLADRGANPDNIYKMVLS